MNSSDVTAGTNATATQYNNLRKDFRDAIRTWIDATDGATITFDVSLGALQRVTLGANRILAISNDADAQAFVLRIKQDATGSRTVTWFAGISWAGGSVPTLTTTINKADTFLFLRTGTNTYDGFIVGQNI